MPEGNAKDQRKLPWRYAGAQTRQKVRATRLS